MTTITAPPTRPPRIRNGGGGGQPVPTLREIAAALLDCRMMPGTRKKRAAHDIAKAVLRDDDVTAPQILYLLDLVEHFRRQIPARMVARARALRPDVEALAAAERAGKARQAADRKAARIAMRRAMTRPSAAQAGLFEREAP